MALNGSRNAAILAASIIGAFDEKISEKILAFKKTLETGVMEKIDKLKKDGWENNFDSQIINLDLMEKNLYKRRDFLGNVVKAGAAGMIATPLFRPFIPEASLTVSQIIDRILAEVPGGKIADTVDTLKSGSGDSVVTGIITTMFATVKVIELAVKMKANFIIAHEPSYYNHLDDANWVENNTVVQEKKALLEKNQITIWRFHDHWHRMKPDGILHGVLLKTGWLAFNPKEENIIQIPRSVIGRYHASSQRFPRHTAP